MAGLNFVPPMPQRSPEDRIIASLGQMRRELAEKLDALTQALNNLAKSQQEVANLKVRVGDAERRIDTINFAPGGCCSGTRLSKGE